MKFDWTISLQSILTILGMLVMITGGAYKLVWNHMTHMEARLMTAIQDVKADVKNLEQILLGHVTQSRMDNNKK